MQGDENFALPFAGAHGVGSSAPVAATVPGGLASRGCVQPTSPLMTVATTSTRTQRPTNMGSSFIGEWTRLIEMGRSLKHRAWAR